MATRGPYVRSDGARTRGRVLSLLFGGIFGLWVGAKMIPYQLVTRNPDPEPNEKGDRPLLRMRIENTKPLELKPQYKEALHRQEVERIIAERREKQRLEGSDHHEQELVDDASRQVDESMAAASSASAPSTVLRTENDKNQSTIEWLKSKFIRG
ncbi:hypothetical protein V1525DRAFT_391951 [Lipomyces kononenkoae]|uniref:Uncharacterized protein n=1 Tax=Lipomyces kononenkoae TaxID=34357 RepID=A0ACC3SQL0_LIPKO